MSDRKVSEQSEGRRSKLRRLVIASASSPLNLAVGGTGVAAAVVLGAAGVGGAVLGGAVLGLGVLAYGSMIALDLMSPRFVQRQLERERVAELPELEPSVAIKQISTPDLRNIYQAILIGYEKARRAFEASSPTLAQYLEGSLTRCAELVEEAGRIAIKGDALCEYLNSERAERIEGEARALDESATRASDAKAAENYRKAADAARDKLATHRQIEGLYDRIRAQLAAIATSTDGTHAKIVKLQATDLEDAASVNQSISENLDTLSSEMRVLEGAVEETLAEISR